jgi:hypothetical protein
MCRWSIKNNTNRSTRAPMTIINGPPEWHRWTTNTVRKPQGNNSNQVMTSQNVAVAQSIKMHLEFNTRRSHMACLNDMRVPRQCLQQGNDTQRCHRCKHQQPDKLSFCTSYTLAMHTAFPSPCPPRQQWHAGAHIHPNNITTSPPSTITSSTTMATTTTITPPPQHHPLQLDHHITLCVTPLWPTWTHRHHLHPPPQPCHERSLLHKRGGNLNPATRFTTTNHHPPTLPSATSTMPWNGLHYLKALNNRGTLISVRTHEGEISILNTGPFRVHNCSLTSFWNDIWLGDKPFREVYHSLFNIVRKKNASVASVLNTIPLNISFLWALINDNLVLWNGLV